MHARHDADRRGCGAAHKIYYLREEIVCGKICAELYFAELYFAEFIFADFAYIRKINSAKKAIFNERF